MKKYEVTLKLINIDADNEDDAKKEFWKIVMEDKGSLDLIVEDITLEE